MEERTVPPTQSYQPTLRECFQDLSDPRREHCRLYSLWDIVGLTLCAVLCGCDNVVEIEEYGVNKYDFLRSFLDLENGIPSHDTIGRVFALLDPKVFRTCFANWTKSLAGAMAGRVIAIDGKTLRGTHDGDVKPLHLVSAFATENRLVLTQQAVDEKSNEIRAIPEVLRALDVRKAIVTIDAMGCQKEIAAQIKDQGADYVLSLKDNHPTLHGEVRQLFLDAMEKDFAGVRHEECQTQDAGHGRKETRTYHLIRPNKAWLERHPEWKGLKTLGMVCSERQVGQEKATAEVRFFLTSLSLKVTEFARAVRSHWGIENRLHWVLDVSYREDESRLRKDHSAENMAWIRRMTVPLLAQEGTKASIRCKRKMAGWNDEYLLSVASRAVA
jgi:predicted transposase YbfD/YdcC